MVIVSNDGRYHGHVGSVEAAKQIPLVRDRKPDIGKLRLLTDSEWDSVKMDKAKRADLNNVGQEL